MYNNFSLNPCDLSFLRSRKYSYDISSLKVSGLGDNRRLILTHLPIVRNKGIEDENEYRTPKGSVNDCKTSDNISRAKRNIFELADNNLWEYFFTVTLDSTKYDRTDLKKFHKDFTQFIRDLKKKYKTDIKYLIIPEKHKDGKSWHFHGLFHNFPQELLQQFNLGDTMGKYIAEKVKKGELIYNCSLIKNKFGFCDFEPIKNHTAVSKYVTKYITKDLSKCVEEVGGHLYYASLGLNRATKIVQGCFNSVGFDDVPLSSFQSDYCTKHTFSYSPDLLNDLTERFSKG